MKHILNYKTIIEKDGDYFHGYAPSLPGCHTQGKTIAETQTNLKEAIEVWLESCAANNKPIPKPDGDKIESVQSIDFTVLAGKFPIRYA